MSDQSGTTAAPSRPKTAATATPTVQVQALDYLKLRELAEVAAGVQNQSVDFFFPRGEVLKRAAAGQSFAADDVVVTAFNRGKFPRNSVHLSVNANRTHAVSFPGADAVFWSDAAVHKFLIPYVASAAGESAAPWVELVQKAWNFYPADTVTVYALVHLTSTEFNVELDPADTLLVVYVINTAPEVLLHDTVPVFVDKFGFVVPLTPPPVEVPYHRGDGPTGPQRPDYAQLRAMAEWASALRDEPRYFLFREGERGFQPPVRDLPPVQGGDFVVPAFSPTTPAGRKQLQGVFLQPEGKTTETNLANDADALFWSSGSVEQFVIPYYASKGGLKSLPNLADIATVWETTGPGRMPGEHAPPVPVDGGGPMLAAEVDGEVQVYGLIHLPTSQWTEAEAGFTITGVNPASQIKLLSLTPAGETRMHRLHYFTGRRR